MTPGEVIAAAGMGFVALAFIADRILKPWRVRLLAEADEHRAVAEIQSEEMRSAFRVLTGTVADDRQAVKRVPSLGERMTAQEEGLARIEKALNGGGIGSKISELATQNAELAEDIRETRRFVAGAIVTLTTNQQRIEEQVDALNETVADRLFAVEDAERTHRAILHEVGFDLDPPDDAA